MSDSVSAFCTNCGSTLTPGSAFCDQCGHRAASAQPSPPPQTPPPAPAVVASPPPASSVPFSSIEQAKQSSKGLSMVIIIVVAAVLGGIGGLVVERVKKARKEAPISAPTKPTILADPVGAFNDKGTPPVEVAYIHFLDEAHRLTNGKIRVGSPASTPTRIEVNVTAPNAKPEIVVVVEKSNNGRHAVVFVGPKDAGAVRSYTLAFENGAWKIQSFKDLDG